MLEDHMDATEARDEPQGSSKPGEMRLSALVSEVTNLRAVQIQLLGNARQLLVLAFASASLAIPILLSQADGLPPTILSEILYTLGIVYAAMALAYGSDIYSIYKIGSFIREQSDPEVDRLVQDNPSIPMPHWENYLLPRRFFLAPNFVWLGTFGILVLLLLPAIMSIAAAGYVLAAPSTSGAAATPLPSFFVGLLPVLRALCWFMTILAVLSQFMAVPWSRVIAPKSTS
jgi:hypothetical protein